LSLLLFRLPGCNAAAFPESWVYPPVRLNQIIIEQKISKRAFAKQVGVSENYAYTLTGESNTPLSSMLAKIIAMKFGCDPQWVLHGDPVKYEESAVQTARRLIF